MGRGKIDTSVISARRARMFVEQVCNRTFIHRSVRYPRHLVWQVDQKNKVKHRSDPCHLVWQVDQIFG